MPPRPREQQEQLSGGRVRREGTFSDNEGKQSSGGAARSASKRWSYVLQDLPDLLKKTLNDVNKGYVARVAAVAGVTIGLTMVAYYGVIVPSQEPKPLAKRWRYISPLVPITLIERNKEEGSNMHTLRFALPHSYDYAGYEPVSSVRVVSGKQHGLSSLRRWYTPISHPDERGYIEFAIKDCDPGRMSARLRYLEPGDIIYLGRWMREFHYQRNCGELGLVCTTSGASVALQLMNVLDKDPTDTTKLKVLYCHRTAQGIPFKKRYFDPYIQRSSGRISVAYNVQSISKQSSDSARSVHVLEENVFVGNLDPDILKATMPSPVCRYASATTDCKSSEAVAGTLISTTMPSVDVSKEWQTSSVGGSDAQDPLKSLQLQQLYRPSILVCGPQSMLAYVCGRVSPISNRTYWQGPMHRYTGFLKDMGYERKQVYKFGVSTHFLAMH